MSAIEPDHLPMARYYTPDEFAILQHEAQGMGFRHMEKAELTGWLKLGS